MENMNPVLMYREVPPQVYTVTEVSKLLDLPRRKVYILIEEGMLKAVKLGSDYRVVGESIQKYLPVQPQ